MSTDIRKAYSETYEILQFLGSEFINKIPNKFLEFIEREKDNEYVVNIKLDIPLEEQDLLEDTINILAMLKLDYWCEDEHEKEELRKILAENEHNYQEDLHEKYNPDDIFKNKQEKVGNISVAENMQMIKYKENFFIKLIKKIKSILN